MKLLSDEAVLALCLCLFVTTCVPRRMEVSVKMDKDAVTRQYCAGMKTGEAIREAITK